MATYRLTRPVVAFEMRSRCAFTIPSGSLVEKDYLVEGFALTNIWWDDKVVTVQIPDLLEGVQPVVLVGEI